MPVRWLGRHSGGRFAWGHAADKVWGKGREGELLRGGSHLGVREVTRHVMCGGLPEGGGGVLPCWLARSTSMTIAADGGQLLWKLDLYCCWTGQGIRGIDAPIGSIMPSIYRRLLQKEETMHQVLGLPQTGDQRQPFAAGRL